jgi:tRNA(Ile)-lysidine synthase
VKDLPRRLQELSPEQARFCLEAERFAREGMGAPLDHMGVLVALSGGPDSTALLLALWYLAPRLSLSGLCAAHLDHGLRPGSAAEAEFAAALCDRLDLELYTERIDVRALAKEAGTGIEEASREARYDFLDRVLGVAGMHLAAVGHTLNDLAEDQLMRQIRGAGWPALGGMPAHDPDRRLVRPLLTAPKQACLDFLSALGMSWSSDESNLDRSFFRNRVRLDLLPMIIRENPAYLDAAAALWRLARLDEGFFDSAASLEAEEDHRGVFLAREDLAVMHPALRLRLYKNVLESLGPGQPLARTLFDLDAAFRDKRGGKVFQFPGDKTAKVASDGLLFSGGREA